jgi:splicing factor 3A subunit 3
VHNLSLTLNLDKEKLKQNSKVNGKKGKLKVGKTRQLSRRNRMVTTIWRAFGVLLVSKYATFVSPMSFIIDFQGQKMYSKQTVYDAHLSSKKHTKATAKQATSEPPPKNPNGASSSMPPPSIPQKSRHKSAAYYTYLTTSLLSTLAPILNDTKSNVERRFSLTAREREQELLEQAKAPSQPSSNTTNKEGEEEEEEERIYNPLKLPLGWDGKPIPYWLYKLHGLGVEYRCEICSDHVYMGR